MLDQDHPAPLCSLASYILFTSSDHEAAQELSGPQVCPRPSRVSAKRLTTSEP